MKKFIFEYVFKLHKISLLLLSNNFFIGYTSANTKYDFL